MERRKAIVNALVKPTGEMRSREPSWREQIAWKLAQAVGGDKHQQRWTADKISGVVDFVPALGEVLGADDIRRSLKSGDYGGAAVNAAATAAGTVPVGGDIAAGLMKAIFGGIGAKTADRAALMKAQDMLAAGGDRKAIWDDTGWFQGADGRWRFEIDDSAAAIDEMGFPQPVGQLGFLDDYARDQYGVGGFLKLPPNSPERKAALAYANEKAAAARLKPLGDVMDHPALYEAYDVKDIPVGRERNANLGFKGTWNGTEIGIADDTDKTSTALHELQHVIQGKEGFALGGSPQGATADLDDFVGQSNEALRSLAREMERVGKSSPDYADLRREYDRVMNEKLTRLDDFDRMDAYKRMAGEVEARNVQARRNMTPDQRRAVPPWETQDTPMDRQIVRHLARGR